MKNSNLLSLLLILLLTCSCVFEVKEGTYFKSNYKGKCDSVYVKASNFDGDLTSIELFPTDPFPAFTPFGPGGCGFFDFAVGVVISPVLILYSWVTYPLVKDQESTNGVQ